MGSELSVSYLFLIPRYYLSNTYILLRFLHPGVTDKGNYTMFELIRPMVPGGPGGPFPPDYMDERPPGYGRPIPGETPVAESAWERGLRTAKEMMRKAIKRKEQDMDFEEKKMNLTLAQEELDKENGYYTTRAASPVPIEPVPRHYVTVNRHPVEYRPVSQVFFFAFLFKYFLLRYNTTWTKNLTMCYQ